MKRLIPALALIFFTGFSFLPTQAQDCSLLDAITENQVMTYASFNPKDKETGSHTMTVLSKTTTGGKIEVEAEISYYDKKEEFLQKSPIRYSCDQGIISFDMMMSFPGQMDAYSNMEMEIVQNENFLPVSPTVGEQLNDAVLGVKITMEGGQAFSTIDAVYTDRKVVAKETLTTAAGSFECYKIESNFLLTTKTMGIGIPFRGSSVDYYSPRIGMVKTESYNKGGKMTGYTLLTALER